MPKKEKKNRRKDSALATTKPDDQTGFRENDSCY